MTRFFPLLALSLALVPFSGSQAAPRLDAPHVQNAFDEKKPAPRPTPVPGPRGDGDNDG